MRSSSASLLFGKASVSGGAGLATHAQVSDTERSWVRHHKTNLNSCTDLEQTADETGRLTRTSPEQHRFVLQRQLVESHHSEGITLVPIARITNFNWETPLPVMKDDFSPIGTSTAVPSPFVQTAFYYRPVLNGSGHRLPQGTRAPFIHPQPSHGLVLPSPDTRRHGEVFEDVNALTELP